MTGSDSNGFLPVENGELFYQHSGSGEEQILWVHGLPLDATSWYPQLQYFNQRCQNTIFDLRGYGRSSKLSEPYSNITDIYMHDFLSVLEHCQLEKPILIGFASAGHAALRFAALYPDKISKLIVINGTPCFMNCDNWPGGFSEQSLRAMVSQIEQAETDDAIYDTLLSAAMNENGGEKLEALKAWYMKLAKGSGRATIKAFFTSIAYDDDRALMSRISAPTLIISSRLGQEVPSGTALFLRQNIPNSQLFEINDIDHFAYATKSGLINQVIEQFVFPSCDIHLPKEQEQSMNAYTTPKGFMDLFYDFTGYTHQEYPKEQQAVAKDLSETLARNAVDDEPGPLVVADSKGVYVYDSGPGHKLIVQSEYRAALNSGFYEVTSVSHVGPAIAYLGVLHKYGNNAWKAHIKPMMKHLDDVRNVNQKPLSEHWLTQLNCAAWKGHEHRIQKLIDYACGLAGNYLAMVDKDMSAFSSKHVLDHFLEVQNDTFPVPYNTVMIATFSLAGLKSAYEIYSALSSVDINWESAKVLLHNLAGTNFSAGLTAGSNWLHPLIQSIAGEKLANDRIFIVPYAPAFDGLGACNMSEEQYDRLANTVWGSIYSRPVVMNEAFANVPNIEVPKRQPIPGDYGYTKAHQIDHFLQRLKFSTGNIKEMLSNTVGFWLAGEAQAKNWVLENIAIPGLTDGLPEGLNEYPDNLPAFQGLYS